MLGAESVIILRLVVAAALGAVVGLERSLMGKHAGMRTYALVSLGSALFTLIGVLVSVQFSMFASVNPLHLAGFVAVGIGFIGAGLSTMNQGGHAELTTATGIWVVAAIGVAAGFGLYTFAVATTILTVIIFSVFARVERSIRIRFGKNLENEVE